MKADYFPEYAQYYFKFLIFTFKGILNHTLLDQKKTCILSHGSIQNDGRILKTNDLLLSQDRFIWALFLFEDPIKELEK